MSKNTKPTENLAETGNLAKPMLQDGLLQFNVNEKVFVKLTEKGIEKYVKDHNAIMPFQMQLSYREFENRKNSDGYHEFQLWSFIDAFGDLGMQGWQYYETTIAFRQQDLKTIL